ncbi:MAG: glutathione S-transferase family protein [Alphaproteobacteria bacterium]|nr:glutathione S-transferase family protein [Alphaproteobacteria bacterium]MDE2042477.1 glutathione S-transferase family protein [Alphaproteobacteria bacterium]
MTIYGSTFSPFVKKVVAFASEKGLSHDLLPTFLDRPGGAPNPDFKAASPLGKMPAIKDGDYVLADSTAICLYLDAAYPDKPLIPAEAKARGVCFWWEEFADTVIFPAAGKIFFNRLVSPKFLGIPGNEAVAREGDSELAMRLDQLESHLPRANVWLVEDRLTLAEISLASIFGSLLHVGIEPGPERPKLQALSDKILARPAFKAMIDKERSVLERIG